MQHPHHSQNPVIKQAAFFNGLFCLVLTDVYKIAAGTLSEEVNAPALTERLSLFKPRFSELFVTF